MGVNMNSLSANLRDFDCCPEIRVVLDRQGSIEIQLPLEQQRLELRGST